MNPEALKHTAYIDYPCHLARLQWIFDTISQNRNKNEKVKVLDVGAGTGNITNPLGLIENSEILGIDVHQPTLDIAIAANEFKNVNYRFEYLQDCNIKDFDFIILTEVLEHIDGYEAILQYIGENSKKGMQLLITVPNGLGPFEISMQPLYLMRKMGMNGFIWRVKRLLGKKEPYSQNYDTPHVNFFTINQMKKSCAKFGLKVSAVKKAYVFAPIIETYLPFIPLKTISKIDQKIANALPYFATSGFYFLIEHR